MPTPFARSLRRLDPRTGLLPFVAGALLALAAPVYAQETPTNGGGPSVRPIRFVVSGGLTMPTGGFATYHDLGVQASASAVIRLMGQKLRLRPEVLYSKFDVVEQKVRDIVAANAMATRAPQGLDYRGMPTAQLQRATMATVAPKLPDLNKVRDQAISSFLGTFANVELPLGPSGFQPYLLGGVGAVSFRTDVTTVGEALDGVQWGLNVGAGLRFKLGPIGAGLEARFRQIPVDEAKTFFKSVTAIPVAFSLVF